ncbi:MAG: HRDC domain-containing protein [Candidatus Aenigmarchaeota archaeon]|nr:HRDC domain-containing protein [Candidatus Aenigmarchaeota archaeon]
MVVLYRLVEDDESLKKAVSFWEKEKVLGLDFEMENNLHRYGTHLALIQVSDGRKTWLVDPLKVKDLRPFIKFMENPRIQKIMHDYEFDFMVLHEKLNCHPKNVFDTKIAAELDGRKEFGLGSLLEELFSVEKDSKMQKVDWTKRPMTERMKTYAAKDVIYLIRLRDILKKSLIDKGRESWFKEEFRLLEKIKFEKKTECHLIKGSRTMTGRERAILHSLFDCREKIAEETDRPAYHVIPNKRLLELVKDTPRTPDDWRKMKGVSWLVKKNANSFSNAVRRGMEMPEEGKERLLKPRMSSAKFDYLKEERNRLGELLGVQPYIIMSTNQMEELARGEAPKKMLREWQQKVLNAHGIKL